MQNNDWSELFRLIPADQHNTLVLTTVSGMDLNIEVVLRTDPSFLVFRGRVSGNTDDGRVFFLPYRQIDFLQMNRYVKEAEVREIFERAKPGLATGLPENEKRPSNIFPAPPKPSSAIYSASTGATMPAAPTAPVAPPAPPPLRSSTIVPGISASAPGRVTNVSSGASMSGSPSFIGRLGNMPSIPGHAPAAPRIPNVPVAALVPAPAGGGDAPTPPRNSILERLRAQRNAILPPRPPAR